MTTSTITTLPVDWKVDDEQYRYPSVTLGSGLRWEAYHSVGKTTDWVDGHLVDSAGADVLGLDIVAINAPDECFEFDDFDLVAARAAANAAWAAGGVFAHGCGVTALLLPFENLDGDQIGQALARFHP